MAAFVAAMALVSTALAQTPASVPTAKPASQAAGKPVMAVQVAVVTQEILPSILAANGTVAAWQEAIVGAEVGGLRVAELLVNVGDRVRKGQTLATFASEAVQTDLRLAEAALAEVQATAQEAKGDADRARSLQGSGTLSDQQILQMLSKEQAASARVASAQAQVAQQQLRLKQTSVLAPDDGVVSARTATVGAVLSQGAEMFRFIRKGRIEWRGEFTAAELEQIRAGQAVRITAPGGNTWRGQVRMAAPTVDAVTRRGLAYVDVLGSETPGAQPIRPGAYVRGEVALGSQSALVAPQPAVVARDGYQLVYVLGADQRVSARKVQLGRLVGSRQEILSGLKAGDRIVAGGGAFLSHGDVVQVANSATQAPRANAAPAAR